MKSCHLCSFSHKYQSHVDEHGLLKHFACFKCDGKSVSKSALLRHLRDVHNKEAVVCNICSKEFLFPRFLKNHMAMHETSKYECDKCDFTTHRESCLKKHDKIHRNISKKYQCSKCDFKTCRREYLNKHEQAIHEKKPLGEIQCSQCEFKTLTQQSFESHMLVHENVDDNPKMKCTKCDFSTQSMHLLKQHGKIHEKTEANCVCEICGTKFIRKEYYMTHMKIVHNSTKSFKCNVCDFASKYAQDIKAHILYKHSHNPRPIICELCGKGFISKIRLKHHTDNVHLKLKRFTCPHCDYTCTLRSYLTQHIAHHASNDTKLKCEFCAFVTPHEKTLDAHVRHSHIEADKTQPCPLCDFVARSGYEYKMHMGSNHKGKIKCEFCDYETKEKKCMKEHRENCGPNVKHATCFWCPFKSLKQHVGIHMNKVHGKNTKCSNCEYTSKNSYQMRIHEKKCLEITEFQKKCEFCDYTTYVTVYLKKHMKECGLDVQMYHCAKCEFKCSSERHLNSSHVSKVHGKYTKCAFCVYETTNFSKLRKHEQNCNGDKPIYTCEKCSTQMNFWHFRRHHRNCTGQEITTVQPKTREVLEHNGRKPGKWIVKLIKLPISFAQINRIVQKYKFGGHFYFNQRDKSSFCNEIQPGEFHKPLDSTIFDMLNRLVSVQSKLRKTNKIALIALQTWSLPLEIRLDVDFFHRFDNVCGFVLLRILQS